MGVIYDPAYANIFMGNFELKYIYPYRRDKAKIFLRFIDELFHDMDRFRTRITRLHE